MRLLGHALGDLVLRLGYQLSRRRWLGARRSATKSAIVKSVSCPIAETTGRLLPAMARATRSLLKAARSSSDPSAARQHNHVHQPRIVEFLERRLNLCRRGIPLHADRANQYVQPGMAAGLQCSKSREITAPVGRGDDATCAENAGSGRLRSASKRPSALSPRLQLLQARSAMSPRPPAPWVSATKLHLSALLVDAQPGAHRARAAPSSGRKRSRHRLGGGRAPPATAPPHPSA